MLYKIRCYPMHPLNDALPGTYVPVWVTRGALVAHRYTYAPPRCRTSQCRRTFVPLSVSHWNDLADPVFDGVRLAGFKSRYSGAGVFGLIGCISLSLSALHCRPLLLIIIKPNEHPCKLGSNKFVTNFACVC